ncbi:MAG: ATP-binding protein [Candidatus Muirbacterium halophilum]|nr:ATP-binding protein [Candidatus Muirbacterium halophilum]MCK9474408.1 ATP-binding protein [Candidatus Muirbacterium halophilum]
MLCYKINKEKYSKNRKTDIIQIKNIIEIDFDCVIILNFEEYISQKEIYKNNKHILFTILCLNNQLDSFDNVDNELYELENKRLYILFLHLIELEDFLKILKNISDIIEKIIFANSDMKLFNNRLEIIFVSINKINCIDREKNTCKGEFEDCNKLCLVKNASFNNNCEGKYEILENCFIRIYVKKIDKIIFSLKDDYYMESSEIILRLFFEKNDFRKIMADISNFIYYSSNKRDYISKIISYLKNIYNLEKIEFREYGKSSEFCNYTKVKDNDDFVIDISFQEKRFGCFTIKDNNNLIEGEITDNIKNIIFSGLNFFDQQENEKIYHQKIFQQEKMASLGQLYLGITHEINNPNTFIYGNSELIELYLDDIKAENIKNEEILLNLKNIKESIREIKTGSERISNIVRNLKLLSRFDYSKISDINLKDVILDAINVTNYNIKNNATIDFKYTENTDFIVKGNYDEMLQVFINTILNASQSFDQKRKIKDLRRFQGNISISLLKSDNNILVKIKDNGIGIEKENLKKVFDPFFTTKSSEGTGLGLNIVYSIIRKFGGEVKVDSLYMDFFEVIIEFTQFRV